MRSKMRRNLGLRVQVETPQWADKLVIRKVASRPSAAASIYFDDICCWVMGEVFFSLNRSLKLSFFHSIDLLKLFLITQSMDPVEIMWK